MYDPTCVTSLSQEKLQAQMDAITEEEATILERQKELKKSLYGRFGAAINLEE